MQTAAKTSSLTTYSLFSFKKQHQFVCVHVVRSAGVSRYMHTQIKLTHLMILLFVQSIVIVPCSQNTHILRITTPIRLHLSLCIHTPPSLQRVRWQTMTVTFHSLCLVTCFTSQHSDGVSLRCKFNVMSWSCSDYGGRCFSTTSLK